MGIICVSHENINKEHDKSCLNIQNVKLLYKNIIKQLY